MKKIKQINVAQHGVYPFSFRLKKTDGLVGGWAGAASWSVW
jgi:hypothetical protein